MFATTLQQLTQLDLNSDFHNHYSHDNLLKGYQKHLQIYISNKTQKKAQTIWTSILFTYYDIYMIYILSYYTVLSTSMVDQFRIFFQNSEDLTHKSQVHNKFPCTFSMDCSKWAVLKHTLQFNELTKQTILSFNFLQHFLCIQIKFQKPTFCEAFHYLMKMCVLYTFGSSPVICNAFKMVFVHQCMLLVNLICFPAEHRSLDKNLNKYHVKM